MPTTSEPPLTDHAAKPARIITTEELFADNDEVLILHRGLQYRLRITRQDKLILTK